MKEEPKNVVYVVVDQCVNEVDYQELYCDSIVKFVYCLDVSVSIPSFNGELRMCQFFSFTKLPKTITSLSNYQSKVRRMSNMMKAVLKNKCNTLIIWTFAIKPDHIGMYLQFAYALQSKGKKLIFHMSVSDMEKLTNNSLFDSITHRFITQGIIEFKHLN